MSQIQIHLNHSYSLFFFFKINMAPALSLDRASDTSPAGKWRLHHLFTPCNPFKSKRSKRSGTSEKNNIPRKEQSPVSSDPESECGDTTMSGPVQAVPYHWPHDGPLEPATTAFVIIDMQRDCKYSRFLFSVILVEISTPHSGIFLPCYPTFCQ